MSAQSPQCSLPAFGIPLAAWHFLEECHVGAPEVLETPFGQQAQWRNTHGQGWVGVSETPSRCLHRLAPWHGE